MARPKLTHVELQQQIVDLLHVTGWSHLHVRRTIGKGHRWTTSTNVKGWPDLFCWSTRQPGRFLAIEVKVPPDTLHPDQAEVLEELRAAGVECYVVTDAEVDGLVSILRAPRQAR